MDHMNTCFALEVKSD